MFETTPVSFSSPDFEDRVLILLGSDPKKWQHVRQSRHFVFRGSGNTEVQVAGPTVVVHVGGGSVDDVVKEILKNPDVGVTRGAVDPFAYVDDALAKIKQNRKEVAGQLESLLRDTVRTLPGGEGAILLERILSGTVKEQYGAEIGSAWEQLLALPQSAWNDPNNAGRQLATLYFVGKIHKKLDVDSPERRQLDAPKGLTGPTFPPYHARNFTGGKYVNRQVSGDEVFYKYHGVHNRTGKTHNYLTKKKYTSEADLRNDLAILDEWGIKIDRVTEFRPAKGTWISEGTAARQVGEITGEIRPGGGWQGVIDVGNLPKSSVIRTDRLPRSFFQ